MSPRVNEINSVVESIPDVKIVKPFEQSKIDIEGCITVFVEGLEQPLEFNVTIHPQYPFKSHETETINFSNDDFNRTQTYYAEWSHLHSYSSYSCFVSKTDI